MTDEARQPSGIELGRRAFRRRRGLKSVLISLASTLVLAIAAWITLSNSPGWSRVQQTFFNPEVFIQALPSVAVGFLLNLRVLAFAVVGVLIFSVLIAIIRTLRGPVFFPLRALAAGYTDLFRGMPLIIVLYLVGFGIPGLMGSGGPRIHRDPRHDRAHPHLLGLRLRGVPCGNRGCASIPAAGCPIPRIEPPAVRCDWWCSRRRSARSRQRS